MINLCMDEIQTDENSIQLQLNGHEFSRTYKMDHSLTDHFASYKRDGYTVFRQFMTPEVVDFVRINVETEFQQRFKAEPDRPRTTISDLIAHQTLSEKMSKQLLNPTVLDFAEYVMGPFVQLDSMEITGFPSRPPDQLNLVADWHRDAFSYSDMWANHPSRKDLTSHPYTAPTACNCLTYLQEMNQSTGSLRVIPGSHLDYTQISETNRKKPHDREFLIELNAGDMVFTHNELLHSGSLNTSDQTRYFVSIYFQRIGLPHRDRFDIPEIDTLCENARQRKDRRVQRLFGIDPLFSERERMAWSKMIADDRSQVITEDVD